MWNSPAYMAAGAHMKKIGPLAGGTWAGEARYKPRNDTDRSDGKRSGFVVTTHGIQAIPALLPIATASRGHPPPDPRLVAILKSQIALEMR
jgi:hypothetical protein